MPLDDYPIDDEYIDPPRRRADVRRTEDAEATKESSEGVDTYGGLDSVTGVSDDSEADGISHTQYDWSGNFDTTPTWDDRIDESPTDNDGRSQTRTGFNPRDAPRNKRDRFRRLNKINDGMWAKERGSQNASADKRRMALLFADRMDMTPYQRTRVEHVMKHLQVNHMAHYSMEEVCLSVVSLVANEDDRWIRDEEAFHALVASVDSSMHNIRLCRQLVKEKTDQI